MWGFLILIASFVLLIFSPLNPAQLDSSDGAYYTSQLYKMSWVELEFPGVQLGVSIK